MRDQRRGAADPRLAGLDIVFVEDETMVSFLIEDMLAELGCGPVRHACDIAGALRLLEERRPDVALLDVNLQGELAAPVASRLDALQIPFVFVTGYGRTGLPAEWMSRPVVQKPFRLNTLAAALRAVCGR